jgi:alpha-beta hydrolase superfamily lysophospholipase
VSAYTRDELEGFVHQVLTLQSEEDGPLRATLIRTDRDPGNARGAVLSLHGFCDYFFQVHVARHFEEAGLSFYALDTRRAGRSLMAGNHPHFFRSAEDPFPELTFAIETIRQEVAGPITLLAHSTGCITAALYAKRGPARDQISRLVFNSPFLDFPVEGALRRALEPLAWLGARFPSLKAPTGLGSTYGKTLHVSESGEWNYDLTRKPLRGFPLFAGWIRAVLIAQREIQAGLGLKQPILLLRSDKSSDPLGPVNRLAHTSDTVLKVEHMALYGPRLGNAVTIEVIPEAKHDVFLSREEPRALALARALSFVSGA